MRSTNNWPVWEDRRDRMDRHPLRYVEVRAVNQSTMDGWRSRHCDAKFASACRQKRDPNFYACNRWLKSMGMFVHDSGERTE